VAGPKTGILLCYKNDLLNHDWAGYAVLSFALSQLAQKDTLSSLYH